MTPFDAMACAEALLAKGIDHVTAPLATDVLTALVATAQETPEVADLVQPVAHRVRAAVDALVWPARWVVRRTAPELFIPGTPCRESLDAIAAATPPTARPPVWPGVVWALENAL